MEPDCSPFQKSSSAVDTRPRAFVQVHQRESGNFTHKVPLQVQTSTTESVNSVRTPANTFGDPKAQYKVTLFAAPSPVAVTSALEKVLACSILEGNGEEPIKLPATSRHKKPAIPTNLNASNKQTHHTNPHGEKKVNAQNLPSREASAPRSAPYLSNLGGLGVARPLDLVLALLGEGNGKHSQRVVVGRLHVDVRLDQTLPLPHKRPQLVGREVHSLHREKSPISPSYTLGTRIENCTRN